MTPRNLSMFGPQSQNTLYSVDMTAIKCSRCRRYCLRSTAEALNACPFCQKPFKYMVELEREVSFGRRTDGGPMERPSGSFFSQWAGGRFSHWWWLLLAVVVFTWGALYASRSNRPVRHALSADQAKPVPVEQASAPERREGPFDQERLIRAVTRSDDASTHLIVFGGAAQKLIRTGRCTVAEFEEQGGWVRSVSRDPGCTSSIAAGMTTTIESISMWSAKS